MIISQILKFVKIAKCNMKITNDLLNELAKKYFLNSNDFQYIKVKNFLISRYFVIYGKNEYYFEIDKNNNELNNFFPFFSNKFNSNKIENWIESIIKTKQKNLKIVKKLDEGKKDRDEFKKKYNV